MKDINFDDQSYIWLELTHSLESQSFSSLYYYWSTLRWLSARILRRLHLYADVGVSKRTVVVALFSFAGNETLFLLDRDICATAWRNQVSKRQHFFTVWIANYRALECLIDWHTVLWKLIAMQGFLVEVHCNYLTATIYGNCETNWPMGPT